MSHTRLPDLPEDIILLVLPYLQVKDFLSFCSVNKHFHKTFSNDSSYWRYHSKFILHLPSHYRSKFEGSSPRRMCETYHRRAKLFIWGSPRTPRLPAESLLKWPTEVQTAASLGTIIDVKCAFWTSFSRTVILNSDGELFCAGPAAVASSEHYRNEILPHTFKNVHRLEFPSSYSLPSRGSHAHRAKTSIRQFSACEWFPRKEAHVLALSASGDIWLWNRVDTPGRSVSLWYSDADPISLSDQVAPSRIKSVTAGSTYGAAYITYLGIVFWALPSSFASSDSAHVRFPCTHIQGTGFDRRSSNVSDDSPTPIGEVQSFALLSSDLLIFYTDLNAVFGVTLKQKPGEPPTPVQIKALTFSDETITSLAGSNHPFSDQSFSITTSSGAVHTVPMTQGWETDILSPLDIANLKPIQVPALQPPALQFSLSSSPVISLTPGSTHTLALHASGRISAHGSDPRNAASLGLSLSALGALFRGLRPTQRNNRPTGSSELLQHSTNTPHHIWFDPSQRLFLLHLARAADSPRSRTRVASLLTSDIILAEFSEWVEQEGLAWDAFPGPDVEACTPDRDADIDPEGLGAYFAVSVSSSRYHGAAIVLVNEALAARVRQRHALRGDAGTLGTSCDPEADEKTAWRWDSEPFPRVDLPSSGIMDGSDGAGISPWRFGKPRRRDL